jgi:predicted transposase YbfD/YdcC
MPFIAKKTLEAAKEWGNEVIVQVKANQKTLCHDCQRIVATTKPHEIYQEPLTKSRNRLESRQVDLFLYPLLTDYGQWGLVKAVIKVTRFQRRYHTKKKIWQNSDEVSFYISTIALSAEQFCQAIRRHWHTENKNHYVRDVTLGEDKSRIRINPHIFAKLRSFALNLLRANGVENVSAALFDNCMDLHQTLNYVGIPEN